VDYSWNIEVRILIVVEKVSLQRSVERGGHCEACFLEIEAAMADEVRARPSRGSGAEAEAAGATGGTKRL
jgi:hypothetical protein